jgi:uncharacterized LabA/DUF88 family protein
MNDTQESKSYYAFIDSQNLNVSIQKLGWKLDWKKFRKFLREKYNVNEAFMFIGYMPEHEKLYEQMHQSGYKVVLKPTYDMTKPQQELTADHKKSEDDKHIKGNIDADMVLWAMKELPKYSAAVIVSGDGDFYGLVEYLEQVGKLKNILVPTGHFSNLYNRYESYIVRLDQNKKDLVYYDRKFKKR